MILTFFDLRINRDNFLSQIDIENLLCSTNDNCFWYCCNILSLHILHLQHFRNISFGSLNQQKVCKKRSIIPISCHVVAISPIMGWSLFMHKGFGKFLWTIERALKKLQPDYEGMFSFQRGFQGNVNYWSHGLRTPNEGINQRYLKNWADVADKICFGRT